MPLQDLLHTAGLTRVSIEIERVALPSIHLNAHPIDEAQIKPGMTRFGGSPDALSKWAWPEYNGSALPFIAQINLAEIASYTATYPLPTSGMLYFFFDVDAFFDMWPRDPTTWRVLYDENSPLDLQHIAGPVILSKEREYHTCAVTCSLEWTLPDYSQYDSTSLQRLGLSQHLTDEEEQAYYDVQKQLAGLTKSKYHTPIHRILGHPDDVQWDMHGELGGEASDWLLLLQVDSDGATNTDWGDTGRIYYWIRKQDVLRRDFSQVQLILQCT